MERKLVDEDDSVALAQLKKSGRRNVEKFNVAVIDTVFAPRKLTAEQVRELRFIPGTDNKSQFLLEAGTVNAGNVTVPVVECRAPYKMFLDTTIYRQEITEMLTTQQLNDPKALIAGETAITSTEVMYR